MNRILHVDGNSFFASCEIALARDRGIDLSHHPVWVGGGRRGDGIVSAANRAAKKFGVKTCMPCFEAKRLCPRGVLCRPHYDAYRDISAKMFRVLGEYSPTLVPVSIDEGFLDLTAMDSVVWRLDDLRVPYGNHLETLKDDRKGQHSIRVNDQWRICFRWHGEDTLDVEIVDYH
jgi:nucleotidyltransferase/DNA polymerase involved in DNA repair